jgi:hypothetical protein
MMILCLGTLCDWVQVGGDEDVPSGCVAVLCGQSIDVLCHAALRARSAGALVATCSDAEQLKGIAEEFDGHVVQLRQDASYGSRILCMEHTGSVEALVPHKTASEPQLSPSKVDLSFERSAQ